MDTLSYFHLTEHPFRIGPDPRYLYFSDQVKEAIAKCEYMAQERIGPVYTSTRRKQLARSCCQVVPAA